MLIQTLEQNKIVTYFYNLVEIPFDESADSLKDVIMAQFAADGIYDVMKVNERKFFITSLAFKLFFL